MVHTYFLENKSSVINGADIVINSLHKTLPSLTQTAIMHVNGEIINPNRVEEELNVFETSSPSYVLLSSIDSCINLLSKKGSKLYNNYLKKLSYFDKKISVLKNLVVINHSDKIKHNGFYDFDKGKIVISTSLANLSGNDLMKLLRYEKIECEMCYTNYVIAMTSIFDSMKNIKILAKKLIKIDKTLEKQEKNNNFREILPKIKYTSFEVRDKESESIKLDSSIDKISKEYVYAYPPGIPLIVPGEVISKEFVKYVNNINQNGVILNSTYNDLPTNITIIK
jgi:arginine decarboxylase